MTPGDLPGTGHLDRVRLDRLLGTPEASWLVDRVRRRLEREEPLTGSVTLAMPSSAQRAAVERLLGRAPRGGQSQSLTVRLESVDEVLRRSGISPDGLAAAVAALVGPVVPARQVRDREVRAWEEAYRPLATLAVSHPELSSWAGRLRADGMVRRLCGTPAAARALLHDAVTVLEALPAEPAVSLPAFAARLLGSAHALDDGVPLATVVLSGVRALTGHPDGAGAGWRRAVWASAGLLRDDVSSTALVLNLRGSPALDWLADTGEPAVLTLRQLTRGQLAKAPAVLHICENPAVLSAAADAYGPGCPPLLCLQGQPSAAALALLRQLHAHGAAFRYHGDFDWGGLRIAATLRRHVPWDPWRFTAADYRAAVARIPHAHRLTGAPATAPWDPALASALTELGTRVEEEAVLADLLADLGLSRGP
ncbi:TIGR02679 family protein [Streptomyces sp. ISL-96]|nr:TIGR02679 family protein [Streptomyces sp. ISL-96]